MEVRIGDEGRLPVLVRFESGSSELTDGQREAVGWAAQDVCQRETTKVTVTGEADDSASRAQNQVLSMQRAETVRRQLIAFGVPEGLIVTAALDEDDLRYPEDIRREKGLGRIVRIQLEPPRAPLKANPCVPKNNVILTLQSPKLGRSAVAQ